MNLQIVRDDSAEKKGYKAAFETVWLWLSSNNQHSLLIESSIPQDYTL
jgi:hypothetical protein